MMLDITTKPEEPIISIGVAAKKLGVSPESLRLYEREGLVIPYRTSTGRRLFSQKDLEWIDCFRTQIIENKMNFAGIRILLALMPCWDIKPCSEEERKNCNVYFHSDVVCWTLEKTSSRDCNNVECRECIVYHDACRAGKLDTMYISSKEE